MRSLPDTKAHDRRPAPTARLAFTAIDTVLELEESFVAVGIDIIGNTRTAKADGLIQNFLQCEMQALEFVASER